MLQGLLGSGRGWVSDRREIERRATDDYDEMCASFKRDRLAVKLDLVDQSLSRKRINKQCRRVLVVVQIYTFVSSVR